MSWQFAIVNGKLAELYSEDGKILGYCHVDINDYKTKKEKEWISSDIKDARISYRKGVFRNMLTKKIIPQVSLKEKNTYKRT